MKKIPGLMFAALATLALAVPVLAQVPPTAPPAPPAATAPPAPSVPLAATAPPAPPAAPPAPPAATAPRVPNAPPAAMTRVAVPAQPAAPPAPPVPVEQATPQKPPRPAKAPDATKPPEPPQPPPPSEARDRGDAEPVNVRFEVAVSSQTGTAAPIKRTALVTVSNSGPGWGSGNGMLRSGNSVPVPSTSFMTKGEDGKETPAARPLTSYSYRSVGLNVDASQVSILPSNRVRAILNIEFSGLDEKAASFGGGAPSFPTFSQRLSLFFESGKPVVVAQSSDFVDNVERKQTVEVKATILR